MNCDYYRVIVIIQSIRYSNRGLNKSASVKVKTRLIFIVVVQGRNERRGRKGDKGTRRKAEAAFLSSEEILARK